MQSQEHFIVDFGDFILRYEHILNLRCTFEGVRFDAGNLIATQIQFHKIWQSTKQTIRFDTAQFIIVQ